MTLLKELAATGNRAARALRFLSRGQRLALVGAVAMMLLVGFSNAQIPLILGTLVDRMFKGQVVAYGQAIPYLLAVGAFLVGREILQVVRRMLVENTATRVERDATIAAVSHLLMQEVAVLRETNDGALNGRVARSVMGLVKLLKLAFLDALPALATAVFALVVALQKNLLLGGLMASVIPIGLLLVFWQMSTQRGVRLALLESKEQMDGLIVEQLGGIESIRAAHTLDHEIAKVKVIADETQRREFRHHVAMALFDAAKSLNEGAFYLAVVAVSLALALGSALSTGDILAFTMLFATVLAPLREIHRILDEAHESGLRAEAFFDLLDCPSDVSFETVTPEAWEDEPTHVIEAEDLVVSRGVHPAGGRNAIDGVTFAIRRGEVVGIAGPSGSGKSTLTMALLRLVHPTRGSLRLLGTSVSSVSRAQIGRLIGYVGQEPFLFSGSVADNIAYGTPNANRHQVIAAARQANVHEEITALAGGYDAHIAGRGRNLSGGQRQRIALARVFLQQPPILLLDEATAALDNENERAVMDALDRVADGRTVIMIAHRLTSLRRTDRILVFDGGKLAESGDYATLSERQNGVFRQLLEGGPARAPQCSELTAVLVD